MEHSLLNVFYRIMKEASMKILDKTALIAKLKERIEEAKRQNQNLAEELQKLLESVIRSQNLHAV